jgi:hypothetical protein
MIAIKYDLATSDAFIKALGALCQLPFPMKTAYWLARSLRVLNTELEDFHKVRIGLLRRHGKEEDGRVFIEPSNLAAIRAFQQELIEFSKKRGDIEIPLEKKVNLPEDDGTAKISPNDLFLLADIVDLGEDNVPASPSVNA